LKRKKVPYVRPVGRCRPDHRYGRVEKETGREAGVFILRKRREAL